MSKYVVGIIVLESLSLMQISPKPLESNIQNQLITKFYQEKEPDAIQNLMFSINW